MVSDDDDDAGGPLDRNWPEDTPAPPLGAYDDEDEDTLDLQATQWITKRNHEYQDNTASEQGVIEEVFCRNFMCHSKLRIKLGPLINFVIGHNGSGKSAVLTALTMCLGGKASSTNRGASLKSLIKEGEDSATLSVKIKNQGEGAYKHALYGDSIIVERHFTRAGTSGFKLKNANDKLISNKKADLDDIMDFFAFQLDNPINVLTQDMARQFLSNSTPSDKYKFFIRGTQLEVLDADYKLMEEHVDSIDAKLRSREEDIKELKQRAEEAEKRKQLSERTATIKEKIDLLQKQHAWAQVEEQERYLEKYRADAQQAAQTVQERTEAAQSVEGAFEGHNQSYEAALRMVEDLQGQLRPLTDKHAEEKEVFDRTKDELVEKHSEDRVIRTNMTSSKKTVKKYEEDIRREKTRLAEAEGPEHAERLQELEDLRVEAAQKQQEQADHSSGFAELERERTDAQQQLDQGNQLHDQARDTADRAEGRLRSLQQNQDRQFAAYRPNMEALVRAINNETRWRVKPVGPMGRHIRLLKPEWSSQIERTLGGNLEAFVVTCTEDQALLSQVMKRVQCTTSIFIGHPTRLDTTGKEPVESVDTILRVLEIDNDLVRNLLIINQMAEQTALIPDFNEAHDFMYSGERPRNVKATIAFPSDRTRGIRYEFSARGAAKSSNLTAWVGHARMRTDIQDQTRMAREQRDQAAREFENAKQNSRNLQNALLKARQELERFARRTKELKTQHQHADDAVEQKQAEIDSNRPQDGKLQELERQLSEAKNELEAQEQSYQDMVVAKDDLNRNQREFKNRLDAATAELDQGKAQVKKAEKRVKDLETTRIKALQEKNLALELIDAAKQEQNAQEEKAAQQEQTVHQFAEAATEISRRIPIEDGLTCAIIDRRIDKFIQDRRQAEENAGGTVEELLLAWQKAKGEHDEAMAQTHGMTLLNKVCYDVCLPQSHNNANSCAGLGKRTCLP